MVILDSGEGRVDGGEFGEGGRWQGLVWIFGVEDGVGIEFEEHGGGSGGAEILLGVGVGSGCEDYTYGEDYGYEV